MDDSSAPFPHCNEYEIEELATDGFASLLRIERGRIRDRHVFGPVRLHYGLFQIRARHCNYLVARRSGRIAGAVGFMVDEAERTARVFELIAPTDDPTRCLLARTIQRCQEELGVEYIDIDVSAYAPRTQRTLLELGFEPVGYVPGLVFHEVERLDVIKMAKLLVPLDIALFKFARRRFQLRRLSFGSLNLRTLQRRLTPQHYERRSSQT